MGVALLRVSTDKQFQDGESIENQRRKVEFVARRDRIDIVRFFVEHYSGRKSDRRIIDEFFVFLSENPDIKTAIIGDIDRFTRGGSGVYLSLKRQLAELNVSLIDTTGIIQPERNRLEHLGVEYPWSIESPSRYAEVFMAEKARAEASDILTRTIGQQVRLTREGFQCRGANFGYRNVKITTEDGKKKTTLILHEVEAPFIIRMFELKAEGTWTDDAICEAINAMGYRSRRQNIYDKTTGKVIGRTEGKQLEPKQLGRYISRPIYCGIRFEHWNEEPIRAPIEPLVSMALFNAANRGKLRISEHADGRIQIEETRAAYQNHRHNPEFLWRHVVVCPECGKPLTASKSRGKSGQYWGYYHCGRGHKRFSVSQKEFETTIGTFLNGLEAKPGFLPLFKEVVRDVWMCKTRAAKSDSAQISEHIGALRQQQDALIAKIPSCTSQIVQEKLEHQVEELEAAIRSAEKQLRQTGLREGDIAAYFAQAKKLMEHPREAAFCAGSKPKLEKVWSFIFRALPSTQNLSDGTPQLTLLYRLNRGSDLDQNQLAGLLSAGWNPFVRDVKIALGLG